MKHIKEVLLISSLFLVSCTGDQKEIDAERLVERQGMAFEINQEEPFTGRYVDFHKNGQLKSKGQFLEGKKVGVHEKYYENGDLLNIRTFKLGKKEGIYEEYKKNGNLIVRQYYKDDELDQSQESLFHSEGVSKKDVDNVCSTLNSNSLLNQLNQGITVNDPRFFDLVNTLKVKNFLEPYEDSYEGFFPGRKQAQYSLETIQLGSMVLGGYADFYSECMKELSDKYVKGDVIRCMKHNVVVPCSKQILKQGN